MKVLMICGSPNEKGCTYTALTVIKEELSRQGIESEICWIGNKPMRSCIGCGGCKKNGDKCVFNDDSLVQIAEKAKTADGYIFAAPVHYASPNGATLAFLDRLLYSVGKYMQFKPCASVVSARRAGAVSSYDVLNKYIGINNMIQVPSTYWNMVYASTPEDVYQDAEGLSILKAIASNMAWMLKVLQSVKGTNLEKPEIITKVKSTRAYINETGYGLPENDKKNK